MDPPEAPPGRSAYSLLRSRFMGTSMRLYLAPDSDLRAFAHAPRTLQMWLGYARAHAEVSLHERWQDLDAILSGGGATPSPLRPGGADYTYPFVADRGAHALSSTSTERLLHSVEEVDRARVEAYVRNDWATRTARSGRPADPTPAELAASTDELLMYLDRLRQFCAEAVVKKYGLLMALRDETAPLRRAGEGRPTPA
jgi:hypothetical protein